MSEGAAILALLVLALGGTIARHEYNKLKIEVGRLKDKVKLQNQEIKYLKSRGRW